MNLKVTLMVTSRGQTLMALEKSATFGIGREYVEERSFQYRQPKETVPQQYEVLYGRESRGPALLPPTA